MYVDEVGNPDLRSSADPNHRYLSLTGVIFELGYVDSVLHPAIEALKRKYFVTHADDPIVFHRKELVNRKEPFEALRDPSTESAFNQDLLKLVEDLDFVVITAVIDKLEHQHRYTTW